MIGKITIGHLLRHSPSNDSAGLEAAVIDVAQDFLLTHLQNTGVLDNLAMKGGTALRKFYAGNSGRFSTDLDFSLTSASESIASVQKKLFSAINEYSNEYFDYKVVERRGRIEIQYESSFVEQFILTTKIDIGSPLWTSPNLMNWVDIPIHKVYNLDLPKIKVINLEENISEKLARVNRRLLARDLYDLVWVASTVPYSNFNRSFVQDLAILKIWVDNYGVSSENFEWGSVIGAKEYRLDRLDTFNHKSIDDEQIGLLTVPLPKMDELLDAFIKYYKFLMNSSKTAQTVSIGQAGRREILQKLRLLDNSTFNSTVIW